MGTWAAQHGAGPRQAPMGPWRSLTLHLPYLPPANEGPGATLQSLPSQGSSGSEGSAVPGQGGNGKTRGAGLPHARSTSLSGPTEAWTWSRRVSAQYQDTVYHVVPNTRRPVRAELEISLANETQNKPPNSTSKNEVFNCLKADSFVVNSVSVPRVMGAVC